MQRFTNIESTSKRVPPVYGYLAHELLPLLKAIEPLIPKVHQLDRFAKIAKSACHFPSEHGLTRDESAAVFLYTMDWGQNSFYHILNHSLRAEDRSTLKPWFGYLKLFDSATQKLPTVRQNLWRGVPQDVTKSFQQNDEFTWWTISSCSTSIKVLKDFLGPDSTLFLIEAVNGKDISHYTNYPSEHEVILCPGTRLRVLSDPLDQASMHLVHLQEITDNDNHHGQLSNSLHAMSIPDSNMIHQFSQPPPALTDTYNDMPENTNEGEMKDGKKHATGKMNFATDDWVRNKRTGHSVRIFANGDRYEGQWKDEKKHGKGTFTWAPESNGKFHTYIGGWAEDKRTGHGVQLFADGRRYQRLCSQITSVFTVNN
ncbi:unnamed protein product [Adineta ricciae]|uniref:NAD(P)(+)--arginine ADP-ribosyltransferase n=1 Tax=Adineta ricciae TaxID=249248 RepID=A0A815EXN9_ADIRI|nr:unnamed protein product [Adineta ricciae]CAF1321511.1 unnamed protein product [Adineta ricciae]